jgi:hypothetical protein
LPPLRRTLFLAARPLGKLRMLIAARTRLTRYRREGIPLWAPVPPHPPLTPLLRRLDRANREAFRAYRPGPYEGDATFFAGDRALGEDVCNPLPVWRRVVRGTLTVQRVPGRHDQLIDATRVELLADEIAPRLDRGDGSTGIASYAD